MKKPTLKIITTQKTIASAEENKLIKQKTQFQKQENCYFTLELEIIEGKIYRTSD